jgi:hypothetical protein
VFLEIPNRAAIDLIDSPSARCNRRISAQSSTVITHPIVWNGWLSFQPSQWLTFRPSPTGRRLRTMRCLPRRAYGTLPLWPSASSGPGWFDYQPLPRQGARPWTRCGTSQLALVAVITHLPDDHFFATSRSGHSWSPTSGPMKSSVPKSTSMATCSAGSAERQILTRQLLKARTRRLAARSVAKDPVRLGNLGGAIGILVHLGRVYRGGDLLVGTQPFLLRG